MDISLQIEKRMCALSNRGYVSYRVFGKILRKAFSTLFLSVYDLSLHNNNANINKNEREQPTQMQLNKYLYGSNMLRVSYHFDRW